MCNHAVHISIQLLSDLTYFSICDKEATALHQVAELVLRNVAASIIVTYPEGNVRIEIGVALQVLPSCLSRTLRADQCSKKILELTSGGVCKDVIFSVNINSAERAWSS